MLTLKFGGQELSRDEFEYPIPLAEAAEMRAFAHWQRDRQDPPPASRSPAISTRSMCSTGALAGLVIAELETPDDVADGKLPAWLGREITGEPAYYNTMLALRGRPERQS